MIIHEPGKIDEVNERENNIQETIELMESGKPFTKRKHASNLT